MARIWNQTKGTVVADEARVARSFWSRFCGLMGRAELPEGEALLIEPSSSIHTAFMRFPIDVVFLDRECRVVKVAPEVRPFRTRLSSGHSTLELPAGQAELSMIEAGDQLVVEAA